MSNKKRTRSFLMLHRLRLCKFFKANLGESNYTRRAIFDTLVKNHMEIKKLLKQGK